MATATGKTRCVTCGKDRTTSKCSGCLQDLCFSHLAQHRQELSQQLDQIENDRNIFRQILSEQTKDPLKHSLIHQINQWEERSIEKIKQTADEARESVLNCINEHLQTVEVKLAQLTEKLKELRNEDDYNEISLTDVKENLNKLEQQLNQLQNITVEEDSTTTSSFISKISVCRTSGKLTI